MKINIPDFNKMSDEEFDAWFTEASKLYAESIIEEIESDPGFKDAPGLSKEAYNNLIKRVEELERGGR